LFPSKFGVSLGTIMDFSNPYYGGPQAYQFMNIPPLTPSHSNSGGSDEFPNRSPPQESFDQFSGNDQYQSYDPMTQHFGHQQQPTQPSQSFRGPPGPPTPPQHPLHAHSGPAGLNGVALKGHQAELMTLNKSDPDAGRNGSNSEGEEMTPAQTRRKAQNRAA
jgi:AP-1-like transcription factor